MHIRELEVSPDSFLPTVSSLFSARIPGDPHAILSYRSCPHMSSPGTLSPLSPITRMTQKFRDQVNMGIRAAKAGMPGPVNPMNPAFLHMYMPLLDGRFPYNIGPVELAALAMANNFPNVLLGNNNHHNHHNNGSVGGGGGSASGGMDIYQHSERMNRLSGRSSSSPGTNNNSSSKSSVQSRNSASCSSPSSSSPGHQSQSARRSFPSPSCHAEDTRRKEEAAKKVVRSEEAPLNLSKPRGSQSRSSPLVSCPASPSSTGHQSHQQSHPPASHHPAHQPASPLAGMRPHPMLSPSQAAKFPAGLSSWQPSPLFNPGFYSGQPFIPYSRPNGAPVESHDKPFPFGMFPAGLDALSGYQAASHQGSHHNNGSNKKESPGSAGSVGGFSDSSNLDSEKKEDTVVTCQSEYLLRVSCCHSVFLLSDS